MIKVIILAVIAAFFNATSDEIRFHWDRTFGKFIKPDTRLYNWMNPSVSWTNKYFSENKVIRFLFSTVFVFVTDFWHLLKFLILNCLFLIFLILIEEPFVWWKWLIELAVLNILWGILFELFIGIYGAIGDKKTKI